MKFSKFVMVLGSVAMIYGLYNGVVNGDFLEDGKALMANPWGIMSLIDIYVSMLIFSVWVFFREKSRIMSLLWVITFILLGSLAVCLYILIALVRAKGDWLGFFFGEKRGHMIDGW